MTFRSGFSSWKKVLAKVSLTIATPGDVSVGTEIPPGDEGDLHRVDPSGRHVQIVGQNRAGRRPLTETKLFMEFRLNTGHPASATFSTPGTARKCSIT